MSGRWGLRRHICRAAAALVDNFVAFGQSDAERSMMKRCLEACRRPARARSTASFLALARWLRRLALVTTFVEPGDEEQVGARAGAPVVALLEARMSQELARLVTKHGGEPLTVPALRERVELTSEKASEVVDALSRGKADIVMFLTGVAVSLLFEQAEHGGRRADLVTALRSSVTVCRGPKPTAALRGFGVEPTHSAASAFTAAEVVDALSRIELSGRRTLLFHYGERSHTLAETLRARGAELEEVWLYKWLMPEDTSDLHRLVRRIVRGEVDALAVTCQIQFRHLLKVADTLGARRELVRALNHRVVVGAVGPTCRAILQAHEVRVRVMPEYPKMGPLIVALMRHLQDRGDRFGGGIAADSAAARTLHAVRNL